MDADAVIEAQLEYLRSGGKLTSRKVAALSKRYANAMAKYQKAEAELARASNKWNKLRLTLRRYERELDEIEKE